MMLKCCMEFCYVMWFLGLISLKKNLLFDSSNAREDDSGDVHNGWQRHFRLRPILDLRSVSRLKATVDSKRRMERWIVDEFSTINDVVGIAHADAIYQHWQDATLASSASSIRPIWAILATKSDSSSWSCAPVKRLVTNVPLVLSTHYNDVV